jgi:hypothetical protein
MRAIGYDAATAVADLIDNSITAKSTRVDIRFNPGAPSAVAIIDNGQGMSAKDLERAMRHGSRSPRDPRHPNDLGRFGLGLKTASLSQCRRLTVVSKRKKSLVGMVWDLDHAADWSIGVLERADFKTLPFISELTALTSGTLVLWQELDVLAAGDPGDGTVLSPTMSRLADHLGLVFHRYMTSQTTKFTIRINLQPLRPLDPFLENDGAIAGEEECVLVDGHSVILRAYTLPHISRLTRAQIEQAGGESGLRRQQGFYIYRNKRLIIWGTWFRLFRQEELTKLTRVKVDVPNSLDHLWCLDIKKSAVYPPTALRERLKGLVPTMVRPSVHTHQFRGRITATKGHQPLWRRIENRDGVRYEIDPEHPIVSSLRSSAEQGLLNEFDNVLYAIAEALPVEALYNDRANDRMGHKKEELNDTTSCRLEELARQMLSAFHDRPAEYARLLSGLGSIEPFSLHPTVTSTIVKRLASP